MRIDAHQHFWIYNPVRDGWINDEMNIIQRDFLPRDLQPLLEECNINGTVAVQADQSEDETLFLLQLAEENDFIKGVVGWLDLRSPGLAERLDYFSSFKKLKGLRHIVQAEPIGFMKDRSFSNGIRSLKRYNLTYDILIYPTQLSDALHLVNEHPDQKFVIDHLAKPCIKRREITGWANVMKELSLHPNVFCKLSGMVTEADWQNWKPKDFKPYLDFALEHFGSGRLMYGSDWPVCLVAAPYPQQLNLVEAFIDRLSDSEKQRIMGENAVHFYNL
jgi:L-fuconolactonase